MMYGMKARTSVTIALVIFLIAGVAGAPALKAEASSAFLSQVGQYGRVPERAFRNVSAAREKGLHHAAQTRRSGATELDKNGPDWQQVNSNGFGGPLASAVSALGVHNGYLYAGTSNATEGTRIFRSQDGMTWTAVTQPGFGIAHDIAPPIILDFMVFNERIYATTGQGDGPGQIWRALNGVYWAPMVIHGFGDQDTVDVTALAEYKSMIYAAAHNLISGAQVWRSLSGDSNTWQRVVLQVSGTANARITGFAVFNNLLYAAVESDGPAKIWSTSGTDWTTVVSNGFGNSRTVFTGGMAEFGGYLYVGAGNDLDGAQLWRTSNGTSWEQAIEPGFGDPNNQKVEMVYVFQNHLYIGVKNAQTGIELWRSADGTIWEQANPDGFGDRNNASSNWSNATAGFLDQLYVGTLNLVDGGELWRMQQQPPQQTFTAYLSLIQR